MRTDRVLSRAIASLVVLLFVVACDKSNSQAQPPATSQPAAPSAMSIPTVASVAPATTPLDDDQVLNPVEVGFGFGFQSAELNWDAQGLITGTIGQFNAVDAAGHSFPVELSTNAVKDGKILTRDFGTITVRAPGGFSARYWMRTSQLKRLQDQLQQKPGFKKITAAASRANAPKAAEPQPVSLPADGWLLLGSATDDKGEMTIFLQDVKSNATQTHKAGDSIAGGTIQSIALDGINFKVQDKTTFISIGQSLPASPQSP